MKVNYYTRKDIELDLSNKSIYKLSFLGNP